jgi:putative heme-binding domain-containing protein
MQAPQASLHALRLHVRTGHLLATVIGLWLTASASAQNDPFAEFIRKTEPRTPAEEQKGFHLPPGFKIQLVAAEPEIGKPMNLAFDERGCLWMTQSREYPYAAPTNQPGRDEIKILSDFDDNGRARKIATFADGLNVPIGIYPSQGGAIAFSIPGIYRFEDTDGDGRADKRELLYSGQGYELDTHGLTSGFRRGYDGWLYACHGYRNHSRIQGKDGHTITMNSGNTYRLRLDGSRVEQFTWGQVNPFGLQFDPLGDVFSADCHSSPVYLLLRGAYYPSFGKPHDGLGFGPNICAHSHGSTAIAGIALYYDDQFPPEYRGNSFLGNVMTSRINRDSFVERGSTRIAKEEPDFLRCDDPWFRPVDLALGPDGALYVADFYNRVIGHYEVPLEHPGRDRERGRIWRIVYRGDRKKHPLPQEFDLSKASASELIKQLAHPNLTVRMLAMNQLVDHIGNSAKRPLEKMLADKKSQPDQKLRGLWVLHRLGALTQKNLSTVAGDSERSVRAHAMRVISETPNWSPSHRKLALTGLRDKDAYVQRAAADALGCHPNTEHIRPLLDARHLARAEDEALVHTLRMALRNQLQAPGAFEQLATLTLSEADSRAAADVSLGVKSSAAGSFILNYLPSSTEPRDRLVDYLRHAGRYAPEARLATLGEVVRSKFPDDPDAQFEAYKSVQEGFAQRGASLSASLRAWAASLAELLLASANESDLSWTSLPAKDKDSSENPWALEQRKSADGQEALFLSSRPVNETYTGVIRSRAFTVPPRLTFFLAGHDGEPDQPPVKRDFVRLLAATSGEVLAKAAPPRNDIAQRITWDLSRHAGEQGILEIVDGHDDEGYAWLAAGRFDPPVVALTGFIPNSLSQRQQNAADLVRTVPLPELETGMRNLFETENNTPASRAAGGQALVAIKPDTYLTLLARSVADTNQTAALREKIAGVLAGLNSPVAREAVLGALVTAPRRLQIMLAQSLAASTPGALALLEMAEARKLSPQVLTDRIVKERLAAAKLPEFNERFDALTKNVPSSNRELQRLIDRRRVDFDPEQASATRGAVVFEKNCATCHQIGGKGVVIGPQLDGVGTRGLERLIEDVLDSNRNVDPAFRATNITLKDDTAITGLLRREEGEVLVFADTAGKEITVQKSEIAARRESELSLMPSNFGDLLSAEQFNDLMAFLLSPVTR